MAVTKHGALKIAAGKLGMSVADYSRKILLGERWCYRCRNWKLLTDFGKDRTRGSGRDATCLQCRDARTGSRGPRQRERRKMRALGQDWCSGCKAWVAGVLRGKCREHRNADARSRYASDEQYRFKRKNNTALRRRNVEAVPPEGMAHLEIIYGGRCVYCGGKGDTIDHLDPVSRGGRTTPGNVVTACRSCNSKKKNRELDDWLDELLAKDQVSEDLMKALAFKECSLYG